MQKKKSQIEQTEQNSSLLQFPILHTHEMTE